MNDDGRYCLACDEWVRPLQSKTGDLAHVIFYQTPDETEVDCCYGPFVWSEPPEPVDEISWDYILSNPPDDDELHLMDEEASNFFIEAELEVGE